MVEKEKLIDLLGIDNVDNRRKTLNKFSHDISFVNKLSPKYVIKPRSTAQAEQIVKLANETKTPLVPVSSGPPHFRGDTVPSVAEAVIVDMSEMKKIIRVDRLNRVAMCEPGVTFSEMIAAVEKEGLRLNMPLLPRKTKSVVGSLLEREPVTMPKYHWDISDPLACMEVIFGTGDMFRTGEAAGPGSLEEQWAAGGAQKEAAGPSQCSWHRIIQGAQGTMGVVTWASMRCELLPREEESFLVGSSQLQKIMDLVHWLIRLRLVNECFVLNSTDLAAIMAENWRVGYSNIQDSLPTWVLFFTIAGYEYLPTMRIKGQIKDMLAVVQRTGLVAEKAVGNVAATELQSKVRRPSGEPHWKLRSKGASEDIFFLTSYDKLPFLIDAMNDIAFESGYPSSEIGVYIQPLVQGTNFHCEFNLFYDPANMRESCRIKRMIPAAVNGLMSLGAFFSRPYGESAGIIMNRDAATVAALHKVKSILDPNGVMNPGKLCF
jgi:FAD/FMN-containing dehydrogenase